MSSRSHAIENVTEQFDNGAFFALLGKSVAYPTRARRPKACPSCIVIFMSSSPRMSSVWVSALPCMTTRSPDAAR